MKKIDQHIEIVRSSTPGLSSMSVSSSLAIQKTLQRHFSRVGVTTINTAEDLDIFSYVRPDFIFLGVKSVPASTTSLKKIWLAEYCEKTGIPYSGSPAAAVKLDFYKPAAKLTVQNAGLATARHFIATRSEYSEEILPIQYPLFIKPSDAGGGQGIGDDSVVRSNEEYRSKTSYLFRNFDSDILVEEYLPGREFSVAVMETTDPGILITMPLELITEQNHRGDRVIGHKVKNADTESVLVVSKGALRDSLTTLAEGAFHALGARGYGRIDIRLDVHGAPHFLEANLIPSLIEGYGNFPKACFLNNAMSYEDMLLEIVRLGMQRGAAARPAQSLPTMKPTFVESQALLLVDTVG